MAKTPVQPQDKYVLRLPDGMRDRLKNRAEANGRSMNAEIVQLLERSLWLEKAGFLSEETTIADLVTEKPRSGEEVVQFIRAMKSSLEQMQMLLIKDQPELLKAAREYAKREGIAARKADKNERD